MARVKVRASNRPPLEKTLREKNWDIVRALQKRVHEAQQEVNNARTVAERDKHAAELQAACDELRDAGEVKV